MFLISLTCVSNGANGNDPALGQLIARLMGPTWGPPGNCWPQMGPMLAPWTLLLGMGCRRTDDEKLTEPIAGSGLLMHIYVPCSYTNHQTFNLPLYPKWKYAGHLLLDGSNGIWVFVCIQFKFCCVVLCCVVSCRVSCRVVSCRVVLCCVVLRYPLILTTIFMVNLLAQGQPYGCPVPLENLKNMG